MSLRTGLQLVSSIRAAARRSTIPRFQSSRSFSFVVRPSLTHRAAPLITALLTSLASLVQIRGAKRNTFNPSHIVRKRRHGFLSRIRSRTGRKTLLRRRLKGRSTLSH